jgi:hypothetical protein
MRNRGIELFLAPPQPLQPHAPGSAQDLTDRQTDLDLQRLLAAEGVPGWSLPAAMAAAHSEVAAVAVAAHRCRRLRQLNGTTRCLLFGTRLWYTSPALFSMPNCLSAHVDFALWASALDMDVSSTGGLYLTQDATPLARADCSQRG